MSGWLDMGLYYQKEAPFSSSVIEILPLPRRQPRRGEVAVLAGPAQPLADAPPPHRLQPRAVPPGRQPLQKIAGNVRQPVDRPPRMLEPDAHPSYPGALEPVGQLGPPGRWGQAFNAG